MAFVTTRRLDFGDCDPSGIAYFPRYMHHLVGAMEGFFASLDSPWPQMIARKRIGAPTVRLDLTFVKPGFHGDEIDFTLRVAKVGRSSLDFRHEARARGDLLWSADHRVVATSLDDHRSIPWPAPLRARLEAHLETTP